MIERVLEEDKNEIRDIWDDIFGFDDGGYNNYYFDNVYDKGKHYCIRKDNKIANTLSVFYSPYMLNNRMIEVSMIVGVATLKEYRHQGLMKEMMKEVLDFLSYQNLVTMIQAYNPSLYIPYGFDILYHRKSYFITKDNYQITETRGISDTVNTEDMLKAYALFVKHFNGYKVRSVNDFELMIKKCEALGQKIMMVYDKGRIKGYFIYELKEDKMIIDEAVYHDIKTLTKIISWALKHSDELELILSDNEDIEKVYGPLKSEIHDYTMVRINDYELLNKLYGTDVTNTKDGFELINKPLYMHEEV